jgi:nucleotide-binding universal stress UspA family protein
MQLMVPLDGSAFSEQPLTEAMDIARRSGGTVHLVRVHAPRVNVGPPTSGVVLTAELEDGERDAEQAYLDNVAHARCCAGVEVRTTLLTGSIADSLASYAESNDIHMIMMSTHGRGGISRAWLGSVADRLIRTTHIPVLLFRSGPVRGNAWELLPHILIPLDGSIVAETILEPAVTLGRLINARYTLLQIIDAPIAASAEVYRQSQADADIMYANARVYLEGWAKRLRADGLNVATRVAIREHSAAGIVDEARANECDMIAMATHGRSGWQRVLLGSVTDKVLRTTQASVLTVSAVA